MTPFPSRGLVFAIAVLMAVGPVAGSALATHDGGQPDAWTQEQKLKPAEASKAGASVDLADNTAIVGDGGATKAYVYQRDASGSWNQAVTLGSPGSGASSFGTAVALNDTGQRAVIGDALQKAAYVFARQGDSWVHQATLTPSTSATLGAFGEAVALDNGTALVGDSEADLSDNWNQGMAVVFTHQSEGTWSQDLVVHGDKTSRHGFAVAVDQDTAFVGSESGTEVHILTNDSGGWSVGSTLTGSDAGYGIALALDGDTGLVGNLGSGTVEVFTRTAGNWQLQQTLEQPSFQDRRFGTSVALNGTTAMVGAPDADTVGGLLAGAVYAYDFDDGAWHQVDRLVANDGVPGDDTFARFGEGLATGEDTALIGAPFDTTGSSLISGAAYVFTEGCNEGGVISGPVHSEAEPLVGFHSDATEDTVHAQNCRWVENRAGL